MRNRSAKGKALYKMHRRQRWQEMWKETSPHGWRPTWHRTKPPQFTASKQAHATTHSILTIKVHVQLPVEVRVHSRANWRKRALLEFRQGHLLVYDAHRVAVLAQQDASTSWAVATREGVCRWFAHRAYKHSQNKAHRNLLRALRK